MSSTPKVTKKQKKALAFRERKGKGKATTNELDGDNDVPVMENQDLAEAEMEDSVLEGQKGAKKAKESHKEVVEEGKKRKRDNEEGGQETKAKKKQKGKSGDVVELSASKAEGEGEPSEEKEPKAKTKVKQQKFILFVGNLKYTTTKEAVQAHFASCEPTPSVRLMAPKPSTSGRQTAKSKGFAFLEFTEKAGLQQALKLHQSDLQGRMINVELTAGGGGKSETRINKLKERNKELHGQRVKRLEKQGGHEAEDGVAELKRPQRYSATSGVDQVPTTKRTWTVGDVVEDGRRTKKRGAKKPAKAFGTGVNAIPVG
ncbi:hypothetical protein EW026_g4325 [Hermanssonia centrifuga]|uniref:RRM domain-containing protein n=1 Tax=Hermanssonia centrifuga TaxID=98765 RepID=A0A4V3XAD7_9APHY|nr:hypothetical protein EW026_g4325 [Hermanssonia centrifuga]